MKGIDGKRRLRRTTMVGLAIALTAPAGAAAATLHQTLLAKVGYGTTPPSFARTADGVMHVAFETNANWGDSANGVGARSISPSGHMGPQVQALAWGSGGGSPNGIPGLAVLPGGSLEATFGGSPGGDDGPWGISSTDGGATWSAPVDVGSGSMEFGDSYVPLAVSNGTPILGAGCCGGIVIQQGFGTGAPTYLLTNSSDNAAGQTGLAVDAATGAAIAGWNSNAGSGGTWLQQVAPSEGTAQKVPVPSQYGTGTPLIVAGRDSGPGVFVAYPGNYGTTTHHEAASLRRRLGSRRIGEGTARKHLGGRHRQRRPHLGPLVRGDQRQGRDGDHPLEQGRDQVRADPAIRRHLGPTVHAVRRRAARATRPAARRNSRREDGTAGERHLLRPRAARALRQRLCEQTRRRQIRD